MQVLAAQEGQAVSSARQGQVAQEGRGGQGGLANLEGPVALLVAMGVPLEGLVGLGGQGVLANSEGLAAPLAAMDSSSSSAEGCKCKLWECSGLSKHCEPSGSFSRCIGDHGGWGCRRLHVFGCGLKSTSQSSVESRRAASGAAGSRMPDMRTLTE